MNEIINATTPEVFRVVLIGFGLVLVWALCEVKKLRHGYTLRNAPHVAPVAINPKSKAMATPIVKKADTAQEDVCLIVYCVG